MPTSNPGPHFERSMLFWDIKENDGAFRIAGQRKQPDGMWRDDPEQIVTFPAGATADEVVERMIEILQAAVRPQRQQNGSASANV
jgi:hypothetical protein